MKMADTVVLCFLLMTSVQLALSIKLTYSINEQRPAGSRLGNIADDANLRDLVSETDFRNLRYSFLTNGNPHTSNFSIDLFTGDLSTARELDREALCSFLEVCKLSFEAVAQSNLGSFFQKIQLDIYVNDINDNAPEFPMSTYAIEVSEGANTGSNFPLISAIDKDTGVNNSVMGYELVPKNSPFVLISTAGISGIISISLELVQRLDRETSDYYLLQVLAKDGGFPRRTGTLTLAISVTDVNDNQPVFEKLSYTKNISETTTANTVILTVSATDRDIGPNGNITYHFMPRQPESIVNLFNLDLVTGKLRAAQSLEYEAGKTHQLIVEARDQGVPSKTAQAVVDITIIDTHNDPPSIHINVFHPSGVAQISEFAELGRVVAHIGVEDPDSGANGDIHCTLSNSSFELRELDTNEFKVILVKLLDREHVSLLNVSVTCMDGGTPPQVVKDGFMVNVVDENDNAPTFVPTSYEGSIPENSKRGSSILTVTAKDADIGSNAKISYRVHPDFFTKFDILDDGTLVTSVSLDREEKEKYMVKVLAVDGGSPALTATSLVMVTVQDVNDEAPVFTKKVFHLSVPEEAPKFTVVGQVNATDADKDENAIVMYQLHHTEDFDFPFIVYADGVIKTNARLDRETQSKYEFVVIGADLGRPPLNSTARVIVTVTDVNDHAPVISFPSETNNTITMPHNIHPEAGVTQITATDDDEHHNARLTFSIEGGNGSAFFSIDPVSGVINLKKELQPGHVSLVYSLMIVAQDYGVPQRATQAELFIEVILGNATRTFPNQGSINIITAMVLVGVTVLLAVIVVATILLLRSSDKKKRLYRAKAEEEKVISSMRRQGSSISSSSKNSTTPLAEKDSEKKDKEVSFSLDEENNVSLSSGSVGFNARNNECLFTIPEDTEHDNKNYKTKQQKFTTFKDDSEKNHTHIRFHDDSGSDLSGDVSISDSGRGGSDVELQSHGGSSNVLESESSFNGRPVRHPTDHTSASPVTSFSTFYGSDVHGNSYDNSSLSDSVQMKQFSDNQQPNGANYFRQRPNNGSSQRLSVPQKMRNNSHQNHGIPHRNNNIYNSHGQLSRTGGKNHPASEAGTYVHLKHTPIEGEYMDMNGHKMSRAAYIDETASEMNTSAWDNDTTTSGSYTVDPDELCDEIDRLFFKENINKDIIV